MPSAAPCARSGRSRASRLAGRGGRAQAGPRASANGTYRGSAPRGGLLTAAGTTLRSMPFTVRALHRAELPVRSGLVPSAICSNRLALSVLLTGSTATRPFLQGSQCRELDHNDSNSPCRLDIELHALLFTGVVHVCRAVWPRIRSTACLSSNLIERFDPHNWKKY